MRQKTFEIVSKDEAIKVANEMKRITANSSYTISLKVLAFALSYGETCDMISPICEAFPDAILTGVSVHALRYPEDTQDVVEFDDRPLIRLSFFMFENAEVTQILYDYNEMSQDDVLVDIRRKMKDTPDLKGVNVSLVGLSFNISEFLEGVADGFDDVPFFGTLADMYYISALDRNEPAYIFDKKKHIENGAAFLLFSGKDLYVDAKCIFGWEPIGKAMSVELSDNCQFPATTMIKLIDGTKPEDIYRKYLGIGFDEYLTLNTCEFPIALERKGLLIGRTPYDCTEDGEIIFPGSIRQDDKIRFTYTIRDELIENTEKETRDLADFMPQAIELFVCGNRSIVLRKDAALEAACFKRFVPDTLECHASGEIYYHHGRGEFLNSTIVAAVFREGAIDDNAKPVDIEVPKPQKKKIFPLTERLSRFTQAMSSDLMEYANETKRANDAKTAFLANMSHEIRTPINAVLGMDEMILRETKENTTQGYARDIMSAGKTLLSIINDILDLSKVEEGKMEIIPVQYGLSSIINDLVGMIKDRAINKGLDFKVKVNENIPYLLVGDEIRIRQCVMNLLTNAVKYTEKGTVTFSVDYKKKDDDNIFLSFSVEDTGIGMKPEDMEKLFAPYRRIEERRNRTIEGTGLGMSITRQLLELMGTSLGVESVYGEGSVFHFDICQEVVSWDEIGDYAKRLEEISGDNEKYHELFHAPSAKILIVDDTEMNHTVMESFLKKTLIQIDSAMSGKDGLVLAKKNHYDVMFIDHMMPDMDGIETLKHMREIDINKDTPAIALTANAISGAREMYIDAGFEDYLSKPVEGMRLEKMLAYYLPDDKMEMPGDEGYRDEDVTSGVDSLDNPNLPDWLNSIEEIDTDEGIKNSGSIEGYLSVLRVFHVTAIDKAHEIEELYDNKDISSYTVKVHALKSSARIIGAKELSELAKELEAAGNEEDIEFINNNTDKLLKMYRDLDAKLSESEKEYDSRPKIDRAELEEAYNAMVDICMSMDYGLMESIISDLREYKLEAEDKEKVSKIESLLAELDWDGIISVVQQDVKA